KVCGLVAICRGAAAPPPGRAPECVGRFSRPGRSGRKDRVVAREGRGAGPYPARGQRRTIPMKRIWRHCLGLSVGVLLRPIASTPGAAVVPPPSGPPVVSPPPAPPVVHSPPGPPADFATVWSPHGWGDQGAMMMPEGGVCCEGAAEGPGELFYFDSEFLLW